MTLSRRTFIALVGGGTVLAATAATVGFLTTRTPGAALAPWDRAGTFTDPRLHALSYAILAPNPHNRQPWVAELVGDDTVRIYRDPARNLPETDPFDRQMTIGMGCFLELMRIAASATGQQTDITLFPEGEGADLPVATVVLTKGAVQEPLFAHILNRRSCKEPFDLAPIPADALQALSPLANLITDPEMVTNLRALTWAAFMTEAETPAAYRESVDLMRLGRAEIEASPDGIDLGGPFLESLMLARLLTREAQLDPTSTAYRTGIDIYREMLAATPAYVYITSPGNTRADHIGAGRRWLVLNLTTTALGLYLHPVSQCLQEYPEMAPHFATAHGLLGKPGETVQMLGRLGYGPRTTRSPRWPLETRMLNA